MVNGVGIFVFVCVLVFLLIWNMGVWDLVFRLGILVNLFGFRILLMMWMILLVSKIFDWRSCVELKKMLLFVLEMVILFVLLLVLRSVVRDELVELLRVDRLEEERILLGMMWYLRMVVRFFLDRGLRVEVMDWKVVLWGVRMVMFFWDERVGDRLDL